VFADWLEQAGDPRGELIAVQAQLVTWAEPTGNPNPEQAELRRSEALLLQRFRSYLFGSLPDPDRCRVTFRYGFFDELEADATTVARMLAHPSLRFLRSLQLNGLVSELEALVAAGSLPPTLSALRVDVQREPRTLSLLALIRGIECLEVLDLSASTVALELDGMALARLRTLALRNVVPVLSFSGPASELWGRTLPALVELTLELWSAFDEPTQQVFWHLLASPPPALRVLRLQGYTAAWVQRLVGSPLLAQLRTLDLSHSRDLAPIVTVLTSNVAQLAHLAVLDVQHTGVSELAAVAALGVEVRVTAPQVHEDDADRDDDEYDDDEDEDDEEEDDDAASADYDDPAGDPSYVPDEEVEEPDEDQEEVEAGVDAGAPVDERADEPE
jgi:hypothetical protein